MLILREVVVFLAAAVIAVPLFRMLPLSSVRAYPAAGVVVGPHAARFVSICARNLAS